MTNNINSTIKNNIAKQLNLQTIVRKIPNNNLTKKDILWITEMINTDYFLTKAQALKELVETIDQLKLDCELASDEAELKQKTKELIDKLKELSNFTLNHTGNDEFSQAWDLEQLLTQTK